MNPFDKKQNDQTNPGILIGISDKCKNILSNKPKLFDSKNL
jgi:hypothetical protein